MKKVKKLGKRALVIRRSNLPGSLVNVKDNYEIVKGLESDIKRKLLISFSESAVSKLSYITIILKTQNAIRSPKRSLLLRTSHITLGSTLTVQEVIGISAAITRMAKAKRQGSNSLIQIAISTYTTSFSFALGC